MRDGCAGYVVKVATAILGTLLILAGILIFAFGAFELDAAGVVRMVVTLVLGVAAIFLFIRVGKDILRDLRGDGPAKGEQRKPDKE